MRTRAPRSGPLRPLRVLPPAPHALSTFLHSLPSTEAHISSPAEAFPARPLATPPSWPWADGGGTPLHRTVVWTGRATAEPSTQGWPVVNSSQGAPSLLLPAPPPRPAQPSWPTWEPPAEGQGGVVRQGSRHSPWHGGGADQNRLLGWRTEQSSDKRGSKHLSPQRAARCSRRCAGHPCSVTGHLVALV